MNDGLAETFRKRISDGLRRRGIITPSAWAVEYRRTPQGGPWLLERFPWTREMMNSKAEFNLACKGAQLGITELGLSVGFFYNDIKGVDVLYVLPNKSPDASDFSSARFDAAVIASPHLSGLYDRSNVGHKRAGTANFYIRGGQSRAGLKSVPVGVLILDEIDEMDQDNIPLALERTSGQFEKLVWAISTPTLNNHGIAKLFQESSQERFVFQCPRCSVWIDLTFPECLQVVGDDPDSTVVLKESYLKCSHCHGRIEHGDKVALFKNARWVAGVTGKEKRGFSINQLYSTTVHPGHVAASWLKAQTNPADEQEFWNSKMGQPHETAGAKVGDAQLDAVTRDHVNGQTNARAGTVVTMGVDVGKFLHFEVDEWQVGITDGDINVGSFPRILKAGKCRDFDELDTLMADYDVHVCVIDAHPERRKAFEFALRWYGKVKMCLYSRGVSGKAYHEQASDIGEPLISVDRTSWLDQAIGRFRNCKISLPKDVGFEYRDHIKALARIWQKDADGNPVGTYVTPGGKADHHAHARNYAEIALPIACNMSVANDIQEDVM